MRRPSVTVAERCLAKFMTKALSVTTLSLVGRSARTHSQRGFPFCPDAKAQPRTFQGAEPSMRGHQVSLLRFQAMGGSWARHSYRLPQRPRGPLLSVVQRKKRRMGCCTSQVKLGLLRKGHQTLHAAQESFHLLEYTNICRKLL